MVTRASVADSLAAHQPRLVCGLVAWSGQECQKQTSTSTATRSRANTTSAVHRRPAIVRMFLRNRNPALWSADLRRTSGMVPVAVFALMLRRTAAEDAHGLVRDPTTPTAPRFAAPASLLS